MKKIIVEHEGKVINEFVKVNKGYRSYVTGKVISPKDFVEMRKYDIEKRNRIYKEV